MKVIEAPQEFLAETRPWIFLGGTIDMGNFRNWRADLIKYIAEKEIECTLLNPLRSDWDSSWEQSIQNDKFRQQVEWELRAQKMADVIVYYFGEDSKSPITLLELGLFNYKKPIVYCHEGFYRKGNVDIVCEMWSISVTDDEQIFYQRLIDRIYTYLLIFDVEDFTRRVVGPAMSRFDMSKPLLGSDAERKMKKQKEGNL